MGYNTQFNGALRFTKELPSDQMDILETMMGEDCRDHPEWDAEGLYYVDLVVSHSGLEWDTNTEKTYDLELIVNVVINQMRKTFPDFGLTGSMLAQGEEIGDIWKLVMGRDGYAHREEISLESNQDNKFTISYSNEEFMTVSLSGECLGTFNHDEHGWSGMEAVRTLVVSIAKKLDIPVEVV
jgi:hypothetical protein